MFKKQLIAWVTLVGFLVSATPVLAASDAPGFLVKSLVRGMEGGDVSDLQALLAQFPDVYPEGLITGYYGGLTEQAVKRFQAKHGLEQAGVVGPKTRQKMQGLLTTASTTAGSLPPGLAKRLLAPRATSSPVFASTTVDGLVTICHVPPGNPGNKRTIAIGAPALKAHLRKGSTIGPCGGTGTSTPPTPTDTTAPTIGSPSFSNLSSTTVTITWTTNESSKHVFWYATSSPLTFAPSNWSLSTPTAGTSHTVNLYGLMSSTTYYFVRTVTDLAGNTATSSESTFATLAN